MRDVKKTIIGCLKGFVQICYGVRPKNVNYRKSLSLQYVPKVLQEKNICGNRLQIPPLHPIPPPKITEGLFYSLHVDQLQRVQYLPWGGGKENVLLKKETGE
jgi:hypothetical protein